MKTATLIKVLLAVGLGWTLFILPHWLRYWTIDRHAEDYRTGVLTVTESHCDSSDDGGSCLLMGTIDGVPASLSTTGPTKGTPSAEGAQVKVLYYPEVPESGTQDQPLQVLEWTDDIGAEGRRFRLFSGGLVVSSLVLILATQSLFLFGARRRTGIRDEALEADLGGANPAAGVPLVGLGLTFILWNLVSFAWAGLIGGSVMSVLGAFLLRSRRSKETSRDGKGAFGSRRSDP